ncbi:MAG: hypothetical protein AAFX79_00320 [Planctomycetota bacterium]
MATTQEPMPAKIVRWITKILVVAIFSVTGWLPKLVLREQSQPLVEALEGYGGQAAVYGIAAAEIVAIVLLLIPRTAIAGAGLAAVMMVGAIGSHVVGPVGLEGDFFGVFIAACIALIASVVTGVLELKKGRRGAA